ncbi:exodeoxyribonuclease VII large subunit [Clostridium formicaceticum]|uniref:Exodeoxyribonuclease 7 large subunit n=1 Tax=Clostridium formicaceticum TaxID=1497 RepID=A0AAC9RNN7_9CLOT|nr:exodeoxyribonuclease VII large subunit [Clostridium formicaceticum]AOY77069.1 exodeoxyribonuclease VII large subunit [Clostridium formicaceticum]ARE87575.1 Exodeoxyribonuclease 7 large subunit [Clostridium formicaceticum]
MEVKTLTVSEISHYIKRLLTSDPILCNIHVEGELSNFKLHSSGHLYFTLKDAYSKITCIMFKSNTSQLTITPKDGMKVVIKGYISLYERDGQYQLYVQEMKSAGLGNLHIAFQQLKDSLQKEGIFDAKHKKPIPFIPQKIGIITSPTGAAIRDILSVIKRRFPKVELCIFPVLVQGEQAAASIVKAIELCNTYEDIEVIILGRGGGSIEELWAFNEEVVARGIFHSKIPIVSAVGHETDFTIADFVADVRAQTPSAAAELVVPRLKDIEETLNTFQKRLSFLMNTKLIQEKQRLDAMKNSYSFKYPLNPVYDQKQYIDQLYKNLSKVMHQKIFLYKENLRNTVERLNSLNPLSVFSRGYAVVTDPHGKIIKSVAEVKEDYLMKIRLLDGSITTKVIEVEKEDKPLEKTKL